MDKPADTDRNDRLFTMFGIEKKFECEFYIIIVENERHFMLCVYAVNVKKIQVLKT